MTPRITIEARDVAFAGFPTGALHLYLVYQGEDGAEYALRSGPRGDLPAGTEMEIEANRPIAFSEDARGDDSPAERAATAYYGTAVAGHVSIDRDRSAERIERDIETLSGRDYTSSPEAIRRYAYTFSEGRTAHWLLLIAGDRVDVLESRITALLQGRPDNPVTETGVLREFRGNAYRTRFGQHRADLTHLPLDAVLWAAPYMAIGCGVYLAAKQLSSRRD